MKDNKYLRGIKTCVSIVLSLIMIISVAPRLDIRADAGKWTDEGNYDTAWLGDYDNTVSYTIKSKEQLAAFLAASLSGKSFEGKTVVMNADLDMSEHAWVIAFSPENPFKGTFDAKGYVIKGLTFDDAAPSSAFIHTNKGTIVNALFSINSISTEAAGIALVNDGKINNSAVIGNVGADTSVIAGGIVGTNNGTVDNCYSLATVKGSTPGGICGKNTGTVNCCVWDGVDACSGDQSAVTDSEKISDKQKICDKLNKNTKANGWMNWVADSNNTFDGFPVLTSKNPVDAVVKVAGVSLSIRQRVMWVGGTFDIKCTVLPANATNKNVKIFSTNEAVAVVDPVTGKITAKAKGYAVIRAITEDGAKVADCYITVKTGSKPTGIKLEDTHFRIPLGKPIQLKYTITPAGASYWGAKFTSADLSILDCSEDGLIVGIQPGTTVVTATTGDGGKSISAMVTVVEDTYSEVWTGNIAESFASGEGTEQDPYLIENAAQLALLAHNVNNGNNYTGVYFEQTVGIMLNDTTVEDWSNVLVKLNEWTPIGTGDNPFLGNYDGGGFSVSGVYISSGDNAGLFGYSGTGASVTNIAVRNSIIKGNNNIAALCGYNYGIISDCDVTNTSIHAREYVGGICGYNKGTVNYAKSYADISADRFVGGIAGKSENIVVNSVNYGHVSANSYVGGIVGVASAFVENCFNSTVVYGIDRVGGIAGESCMDVINSYSAEFPSGRTYLGMICGYSQKLVSSYTPENYLSCGNRDNNENYLLMSYGEDGYVLKTTGEFYLDVFNRYNGCIAADSYFQWDITEDGEIRPSYMKYDIISYYDAEFMITLSGADISIDSEFTFEHTDLIETEDLASDINHSVVFGPNVLSAEDILYSVRFDTEYLITDQSYRMMVPFGTDLDIHSFSQTALININDGRVDIYIPETVYKTADGYVIGTLMCVSHSLEDDAYTHLGANSHALTFIYSNGMITTSALQGGTWLVADIGDNNYVIPADTDASTTPDTNQDTHDETVTDWSKIIPVILAVMIVGSSAIIILVQRARNDLRINGPRDSSETDDQNEK